MVLTTAGFLPEAKYANRFQVVPGFRVDRSAKQIMLGSIFFLSVSLPVVSCQRLLQI